MKVKFAAFAGFAGFARLVRPARPRLLWIAAVALPLVLAACNKSGGGTGY